MASITQPPVTARLARSPPTTRGGSRWSFLWARAGEPHVSWRRVTGCGGSLGAAGRWVRRVTGCGGSQRKDA